MALPNLRRIFSSSRTPLEERAVSRKAFFRFITFLASCATIALVSSTINRVDKRKLLQQAAVLGSPRSS